MATIKHMEVARLAAFVFAVLVAGALSAAFAMPAYAEGVALQAGEVSADAEITDATDATGATGGEETHVDAWVQAEDGWHFTRDGEAVAGEWVDTDTAPAIEGAPSGEQRYWVDAQGLLAVSRLVDPSDEGGSDLEAGYFAYATEFGAVAQGKTVVGDKVYLAKKGGKTPGELESGNSKGFLKTSGYDKVERRYYIDPTEHAAITGKVIEVAGWGKLYAYPKKGFLAVGVKKFDDTHLLVADSIGRLCQDTGWVTTKKYVGTSQRYYFERTTADKNVIGARTGLFKVKGFGYAYAYPGKGYVVCGVKKFDDTHVLLADAQGKLRQKAGWVTTSTYAGTSQRYYLEPTEKDKNVIGARTGLFKVKGWGKAYAYPGKGYIVRGVKKFDDSHALVADAQGKLLQKAGWVSTSKFAGTSQRYYLEPTKKDKTVLGARIGLFRVKGWGRAYAYPNRGYVVRGVKKFDDTHVLLADADGKLRQKAGWATTSTYAGTSQRYYLEPTKKDKNVIGARTGLFKVKGWGKAYAYPGKGYIVRGVKKFDDTHVLLADADGRLRQKAGWVTTNKYAGSSQRYYLEPTKKDKGVVGARVGKFRVDGQLYLAQSRGDIVRSRFQQFGDKYYYADHFGALHYDGVVTKMYRRAQGYSSPSKYLLMVDIDNPRTIVFEGSSYNWRVKYIWDCCTGAPETPTVEGTFSVGIKGWSFGEDRGFSCYNYTQIYGDYLFHTRLYYANTRTLMGEDNLGNRHSHGCVHLLDENAEWIWYNVPSGTTIACIR